MTEATKKYDQRKPVIYSRFNLHPRVRRLCKGKTRTQQHFKEECDVNKIMKRAKATGQMPTGTRKPWFGDFSSGKDFHDTQQDLVEAESAFMSLPAEMRKRFNHSVAELLDFLADDKNRDEAIKLGLVDPTEPDVVDQIAEGMKKAFESDPGKPGEPGKEPGPTKTPEDA